MWNLDIDLSSTDRKRENDDLRYILAIGEFEHVTAKNTITVPEEAEDTSDNLTRKREDDQHITGQYKDFRICQRANP